jgi:NTP pyrophosphatase (non-canonical NTP hydrolase)
MQPAGGYAQCSPFTVMNPDWYNPPQIIISYPPGIRRVAGCFAGRVMDLKQLTEEMHRFVQSKGWYAEDSPRPQTPRNLAISLALEAAEVLEHFQWGEHADPALKEELADTALYLLQLASVSHIDLEQAILEKLRANYERRWPDSQASQKESE